VILAGLVLVDLQVAVLDGCLRAPFRAGAIFLDILDVLLFF
jgi:hypothetical protein